MADNRNYYVICEDGCRFEAMSAEQIRQAIIETASSTAPVKKSFCAAAAVKELNRNKSVALWIGTQAEYNAIDVKNENCVYVVSDHHNNAQIAASIQSIRSDNNENAAATNTVNRKASNALVVANRAKATAPAAERTISEVISRKTALDPVVFNLENDASQNITKFSEYMQQHGKTYDLLYEGNTHDRNWHYKLSHHWSEYNEIIVLFGYGEDRIYNIACLNPNVYWKSEDSGSYYTKAYSAEIASEYFIMYFYNHTDYGACLDMVNNRYYPYKVIGIK